jgi:hypothetical protein
MKGLIAMKTLIGVLTMALMFQTTVVPAQSLGDSMKDIGKHFLTDLAGDAAKKLREQIWKTLDADTNALKSGNVLIRRGNNWTPTTNIEELVKNGDNPYLVRCPNPETKPLVKGSMVFPEKIVIPGKGQFYSGQFALLTDKSPLPWKSDAKSYTTAVKIGLESTGLKKPVKLEPPITIHLTGVNVDVSPNTIQITRLGQDGFVQTFVSCGRHDASAKVTVHSDLGERSFDIPVGPHTSQLQVSASERRIFGYGLGTATMTIKRIAEDGRELSESDPLTVNLSADHGKLDSSSVTIPSGHSRAEVKVRSVGLGAAKISAESDSFKGELSELQFGFPISYVLSALAGGMLGGIGRYFRVKSRGKNKKPAFRLVGEGCVVGFLIVAAVAAGVVIVHLPTTVIGTELGALVIATVAGYVGAPMLDKLKIVFNPFHHARHSTV